MSRRLVLLDRDGVINQDSDNYIKSVEEWEPIPGSIDAIAKLSKAGYLVAVITNQSGLGRGFYNEIDLANIHNYMEQLVENAGGKIDLVLFCPHTPEDNCACRKPKTGMLQQVEDELSLSLQGVYFVGDTSKDIEAGLNMDCHPILVRTGKGRQTEQELQPELKDRIHITDNLQSAVDYILS